MLLGTLHLYTNVLFLMYESSESNGFVHWLRDAFCLSVFLKELLYAIFAICFVTFYLFTGDFCFRRQQYVLIISF